MESFSCLKRHKTETDYKHPVTPYKCSAAIKMFNQAFLQICFDRHTTPGRLICFVLLICRCFSVLSFMDYSMACVIFPLYFPVSDHRHTIPLGYTHCNYLRHPLILLIVQALLVIVQSTTTTAKSSCQNHTIYPCSTQSRWCCLGNRIKV